MPINVSRAVELEEQSEHRYRDDKGQPGREPMGERLDGDREFERHPPHQDEVKRTVVVIAREQAIERQQRRQQRAEPQDRRANARQQREIGADGERNERDDDEKEQHAHQRAAADAHREPHVAHEKG
jgi:hypothetical protein